MKKTSYLKRAAKKFLEGTTCKTPIEVVEMGLKSLGDWADTLAIERELEQASREPRRSSSKSSKYHYAGA
jgi:hypothetical protein